MQQTNQPKSLSVAFTGHRYVSCLAESTVAEDLRIIIRDLYRHGGIRHFYCGMATGFDLLAAEAVLELKEQLPDITLSAVVPYRNQSERFYPSAKAKYAQLLNKADDVVVLSEEYHSRCFLARNDYMLKRCQLLIAYYDGVSKGGTSYTVNKARKRCMPTINLYRSK